MYKPSSQAFPERDCVAHQCRSVDHISAITAALTKRNVTEQQLACYISSICSNYGQGLDENGRTTLHIAASCGWRDLCCWLLKVGQASINAKDLESGYTPLHRSLFYGHIHVAITLMKLGANPHIMDKDDLQPADHAMKDRLSLFSINNPSQVYVWGVNNNYTLGKGNQDSREQPELLDFFRKNNTSIKQVAMDKFHSVFVSHSGKAWACGHGHGGRLGLETEKTVLKPSHIKTGVEIVVSASVAKDHTILLMQSGLVYTCGLNTHHVLGHNPPPASLLTPRPIQTRIWKAGTEQIIGTCAARYHSVFWTNSDVFTCGLHAGQLGHSPSPDKTIIVPKMVTGLGMKGCTVVDVAASDGATVIAVKKGDIYVLHQYQTRKIASRLLNVVKVAVLGGELNAKLDSKLLLDKGGDELKVLVLLGSGNLYFWQSSFPQLTRCVHPLRRNLTFKCIAMNRTQILLTTEDGEAYKAEVKPYTKKKPAVSVPTVRTQTPQVNDFNTFLGKDDCRHLKLTRLQHCHRAVTITTDPKGRNFAVVQSHPKLDLVEIPVLGASEITHHLAALLEESHEDDSLHDIVFQIGHTMFAAHRYILALSSEEFSALPNDGSTCVKLTNVNPYTFQQILYFVYTGDCELLHPGPLSVQNNKEDILKGAFELAKKFKLNSLMKRLQGLRYEDGMMLFKDGYELEACSPPAMDRKFCPELYDVKVSSNNGATFKAHKCVLAARLEYFHSMLAGDWIESSHTSNISLPYPQAVLQQILDFLYTDSAPQLLESDDIDYICSILIVADQLFIYRLVEVCEIALSNALNLRNAACLLQLAATYNANQLKQCCMQFICLNLTAMLEDRTLEILSTDILLELSKCYHRMIPAMCKRFITPFSSAPSDEQVIEVSNNYQVPWDLTIDEEECSEIAPQKITPQKCLTSASNKKKTPRVHKTSVSEMQRKRYESVNLSEISNSDLDTSFEVMNPQKNTLDNLEQYKKEWIKVDKTQKIVQNRLKVILTAPSVQPTPSDFTRLVPQSFQKSYPDLTLASPKEFPQLSVQSTKITSSSQRLSSDNIEIKRSPPIKLSQKQRKKLASEGSDSSPILESPSPPVRAWATVNQAGGDYSFVDIMKQTKFGSPSSTSESSIPKVVEAPKFSDIIAEERQQRDNLSKMKTKSLQLTQLEDKAMDDLRLFYNATKVDEERITVHRVLTANIAKPTWITSKRQ